MVITDKTFDDVIKNNDTVVKFGAVWCGPCKLMNPIFDELEKSGAPIVFGTCDVDDNSESTVKYGIRNIPAMLFFKGGELVHKQIGSVPKERMVAEIEKHFGVKI